MNHKDEIMKISKCIWATSKMILELCKPQAAGHSKDNISSTHLHICRVVQRYGPVTVTKIAQQIPISTPYASTVVDELVHKGILRREINTSDRRKCAVTIAPHAKEIIECIESELLFPICNFVQTVGLEKSRKWFNTFMQIETDMTQHIADI